MLSFSSIFAEKRVFFVALGDIRIWRTVFSALEPAKNSPPTPPLFYFYGPDFGRFPSPLPPPPPPAVLQRWPQPEEGGGRGGGEGQGRVRRERILLCSISALPPTLVRLFCRAAYSVEGKE